MARHASGKSARNERSTVNRKNRRFFGLTAARRSGFAKFPALRRCRQAEAAVVAGHHFQAGAGQAEDGVETGCGVADQIADVEFTFTRPNFEPSLAVWTPGGEDAEFGVGEFVAGVEQVERGEFSAAQRATGMSMGHGVRWMDCEDCQLTALPSQQLIPDQS